MRLDCWVTSLPVDAHSDAPSADSVTGVHIESDWSVTFTVTSLECERHTLPIDVYNPVIDVVTMTVTVLVNPLVIKDIETVQDDIFFFF